MRGIKVSVFIVLSVFLCCLAWIICKFVIDMAGIAAPSDRQGIESINDGFGNAADYFHERSGRTDEQREKARNEAGIFYNQETGEYEDDPEKYSRYLDEKFGKIGE